MTTVAVRHDLNVVAGFADLVALLDRGRRYRNGDDPESVPTAEAIRQVYGANAIVVLGANRRPQISAVEAIPYYAARRNGN